MTIHIHGTVIHSVFESSSVGPAAGLGEGQSKQKGVLCSCLGAGALWVQILP